MNDARVTAPKRLSAWNRAPRTSPDAVPGLWTLTSARHFAPESHSVTVSLIDLSDRVSAHPPTTQVRGDFAESGTAKLSPTPGDTIAAWALARSEVLSDDERRRASRFRHPRDARWWAASRVLLRHALGSAVQRPPGSLRFELGEFGKPRLSAPYDSVQFSISHSRALVVIAIATPTPLSFDAPRQIGIDIEHRIQTDALDDIIDALHPDERAELARVNDAERADRTTAVWTRSEATLKAVGTGLLRAIASDSVGAGVTPIAPAILGATGVLWDLPPLPNGLAQLARGSLAVTHPGLVYPPSASR